VDKANGSEKWAEPFVGDQFCLINGVRVPQSLYHNPVEKARGSNRRTAQLAPVRAHACPRKWPERSIAARSPSWGWSESAWRDFSWPGRCAREVLYRRRGSSARWSNCNESFPTDALARWSRPAVAWATYRDRPRRRLERASVRCHRRDPAEL